MLALIQLFALAVSVFAQGGDALHWRLIGPFRGGRTVAVSGVPSQRGVYYFAATDGGGAETGEYREPPGTGPKSVIATPACMAAVHAACSSAVSVDVPKLIPYAPFVSFAAWYSMGAAAHTSRAFAQSCHSPSDRRSRGSASKR